MGTRGLIAEPNATVEDGLHKCFQIPNGTYRGQLAILNAADEPQFFTTGIEGAGIDRVLGRLKNVYKLSFAIRHEWGE